MTATVQALDVVFAVLGIPQPKGSGWAGMNPRTGKPIFIPDNPKEKAWARDVRIVASKHRPRRPLQGPIAVRLEFHLPRGKTVKRPHHTVKPDVDKLVRSVLDALSKMYYDDDAQIVELRASKRYVIPAEAGVRVRVRQLLDT